MKRMAFSLSALRTPYQGRYFYIRAWAAGHGNLRGGRLPRFHPIVERSKRNSTSRARNLIPPALWNYALQLASSISGGGPVSDSGVIQEF
jgi:hypothetical protein